MSDFEEIQRKADEEQRRREKLQRLINESITRMRHCTTSNAPNTMESMNNPLSCSSECSENKRISPNDARYIEQIHVLQEENKLLLERVAYLTSKTQYLEKLKNDYLAELNKSGFTKQTQKNNVSVKKKMPKTEIIGKIKTGVNNAYQSFIKWINT